MAKCRLLYQMVSFQRHQSSAMQEPDRFVVDYVTHFDVTRFHYFVEQDVKEAA
uniref:Uncharacterized protein n=1 Tax=Megaselia scalaris TaxID=36166 RepID=T1GP72_MEGSC